jgi:beta-lactamase class A
MRCCGGLPCRSGLRRAPVILRPPDVTARRPFANRGYARRRSPRSGAEQGPPLGIIALVGLLALIGVTVVWARDRLPGISPSAALVATTQAALSRLVFATATPAPEAAPTAVQRALAASAPAAVQTSTPTPVGTAIPTLRQWDATADGIQIDPVLVGQLDQALLGVEGTVSIAVKDLGSGRGAVLDGEREMEAASLFKLTVMYAVFDAGLSFGEQLPVTEQALAFDAGTMELAANAGETLSVAEALERMITISDNTSAIMLGSRVGAARITRDIAALGMDTTHYSLERMTTSTLDMVTWLEAVARGRAVSAAASADMLHLLLRQRVNDRLPRLLPSDVRVAHKTGNLPGVVNDVGVVYGPSSTLAVAALVSDTSNEAAAAAAIARVGLVAQSYFDGKPSEPERPHTPPQPARTVPPVWREPKPTLTPSPEPEPTATPEPTAVPTPPPPTPVPATVAPTRAPTTPLVTVATATSAPAAKPQAPNPTPTSMPPTPAPTRPAAGAPTPSPTPRR